MNKHRELVSPIQLAAIVVSTMLGVSLLVLPKFVVDGAGVGAPFASIVGVLIAFIGLLAVVLLGKKFSKQTIIGYNEIILGKPVGKFFSWLIVLFFIFLMGLETRHFAEVVVTALLPNTPIQVAIFFMIGLCAATGFHSVATFAYIHFFYMPLILLPLVVVILPSFRDIEVYHITPFLGNNPSLQDFLMGSLVVSQAILNFFIISMVIPFMKDPKKSVKSGIWGFFLGSFVVVILITMTLAVFGEEEMKSLFWPALVLGRMVQLPAEVLARIDSILLISWIFGVYTTLLSYYFIFVRGVAELFRSQNYKGISLVGFPIAFIVAILPQNIYDMYFYILSVTRFGLFLTIVYPLFLLMVAKIRKKKVVSS